MNRKILFLPIGETIKLILLAIVVCFFIYHTVCILAFKLFPSNEIIWKWLNRIDGIIYILGKKTKIIKDQGPFWTSKYHRMKLGIKLVNLIPKEELELRLMIKETIKTGYRYYANGQSKDIFKLKSFFLPAEFKRIKKVIEKKEKN